MPGQKGTNWRGGVISHKGAGNDHPSGQPQDQSAPPEGANSAFPIVGVGASAGGLEAFTELLRHLPADSGLGFVLVQHLDPQHESALPQLLARVTSLPVLEVTNNLRVEPNHVYTIPPNTGLTIVRGVLKLRPRQQGRTPARSIDAFFESLAQDQRECAIGVVLSGTASDGTIGLETIKAEGGITFAQDDSARYDSMPRSAVAAGCVDFVLKPKDIAKELARIAKHPYVAGRPEKLGPGREDLASATAGQDNEIALHPDGLAASAVGAEAARAQAGATPSRTGENGFRKILVVLRNYSGVDFSLYRSTTIQRRITRRVVLNKQDTLEDYWSFLRGNPKELEALYSDVLISVTSFFRNPEAFEILKRKVFPRLLRQRRDEPLRVWVLGCSTGQEAYSIAMTFVESAENTSHPRKLQVFATDLNDALLDKARRALYPKSLAQDVSPERLRRFFVEEEGGYRVAKTLREMVVFARQNLVTDPPFSHIDLISCRNLLIYLEPSLQQRAIPSFHYALNPEGFLFLGASESIGRFTDLFEPAEKKHKIYRRKSAPAQPLHLPLRKDRTQARPTDLAQPPPPAKGLSEAHDASRRELNAQREADRVTVHQFAPPGVLIDANLQILQFRGPTGAYLQPPPAGKATFDILKMAREGLVLPLRAAINKARKENRTVRKETVGVQQDGKSRDVTLQVIPLKNLRERYFLVLFEDSEHILRASVSTEPRLPASKKETAHRLNSLETELSETRDYLQSVQEQHEAATEELQASNEEVQSANEELQSINEELETSKEELESANEELTTVNEEMANRNAELNRLNADLTNLQASTKLPILLLGRDLTVRRFSAPAESIFSLLATDIGRPLSALRHHLVLPAAGTAGPSASGLGAPLPVEELVRKVIDTVQEQECEACNQDGRWYSLRVRPYFTVDNKVDGAVLLLLDITDLKRIEREVTLARDYAEATIRTARDPLIVLRGDLTVERANDAFYKTFRVTPQETEKILIYQLDGGQWNIPRLREFLENVIPNNSFFNDFEVTHDFDHIGRRTMLLNARRLDNPSDLPEKILLGIEDVTERQRATEAAIRLASIVESSDDAIISRDLDGRITSWNRGAECLFGYTVQEAVGQPVTILIPPERVEDERDILERIRRGESVARYETLLQPKEGVRIDVSLTAAPIRNVQGQIIGVSTIAHDISARKRAEESLRQAQAQLANRAGLLEQAVSERTADLTAANKQLETFIYSVAHDLRAPLRAMGGFASVLVQEAGDSLNETGKGYAQRISDTAQFMDELLIGILNFSRISQQRLQLTPVNLGAVVASVVVRLEQDIQARNARLEASGPWPVVLAHQPVLEQALFNLLNNALKFVPPEIPPTIRLWSELVSSDPAPSDPQRVRVWVEDNGIGIAPEHQDQVFRLFNRLHGDRFPGAGVGLAIVQKAIERLGGNVGVQSMPGQGSRFWIDLQKAPNP